MTRHLVTARPIRERDPSVYVCVRCGIQRPTQPGRQTRLCRDCQSVLRLDKDAS